MKMNLNDDTGIGLTIFDRPEHTRSVLNSLEKNGVEHLYVFSDGPRTPSEASQVERTRDVVWEVTSYDVTVVTHEENLGVKDTLINADD
jgi:hypothetical protein